MISNHFLAWPDRSILSAEVGSVDAPDFEPGEHGWMTISLRSGYIFFVNELEVVAVNMRERARNDDSLE
jgi:hypothetical protein